MDDELSVITALQQVLAPQADQTIFAIDLAQARALWQEHSNTIELLITDYRLQDGLGTDLAAHVLNQSPTVRVIIISGFSPPALSLPAEHSHRVSFLEKPFSPRQLRQLLNPSPKEQAAAT